MEKRRKTLWEKTPLQKREKKKCPKKNRNMKNIIEVGRSYKQLSKDDCYGVESEEPPLKIG